MDSFVHVAGNVNTQTEYTAILEMNARDTLFTGWLNGNQMGTDTCKSLYPHGGAIRFGANESAVYHDGPSSADHYFGGDILQLLSYNYTINAAQRNIIDNYYASEYRNQIETDLNKDLYDYRGSYGYEVFGIGQEDINNNHTVAQGTGIVRIDQPDDIDNAEYLMAGHDNAGIGSWSTSELAIDSMKRVAQEWRITSTGDLGQIRIAVDTSQLPAKPSNYNLYGILIDSDGDFSSGNERLYPLTVRSGEYVMNHGIDFTDGEYFTFVVGRNRTIASGTWNDPNIWLKGEVPDPDDNVLISVGDTVDVTEDIEIGAVTMDSASVINMTGNYDFDLTEGNLSIDPDAQFNPNSGRIIYSADNPQCVEGFTYYDLQVRGSGAKTLCGDITVTNSFQIFEDNPTLSLDVTANNYSITLNCDWQNNGTFIPQNGKVTLDGNNLDITTDNNGAETFNKLDVQTTGSLTLDDHVYVTDTLFMNGSNINATTDTLTLGSASNAGTLVRNSGIVLGDMQRWIENTTDSYIYPLGNSSTYRPMTIQANSLSSTGYAVGYYTTTDPGDGGLSNIYEDSLYMVNTYDEGYWTLTANGMNSGDYNVEVEATGYSSADVISAGTRLMTRPDGATDWTLNGNHADATGTTIRRNNVSTLSAEFAVSDTMSCMPTTSEISGEDTVCANTTESYTVMEHSGSDYRWFITGGSQASGGITDSITVDWGSSSSGKVQIVEDNGCAIGDTVELDIVINSIPSDPLPISGPNPDTIVEGNSKIYDIAEISNATSYVWTVPAALDSTTNANEITITPTLGSSGNNYNIEVVGENSCGISNNPATKTIYVEEGLPEKPTKPVGPIVLCQDAPNTDYTTTETARATSYEWVVWNGGSSTISGTDTTGTLDLSATFNGMLNIRVRGVNANGNGPWSDTTDVTVYPQPDGTLVPINDTICEGQTTELQLNFTSGSSPYMFIYSDETDTDTIDPIVSDTTFFPANDPQWQEGATDTTNYIITKIIDDNGCEGTQLDTGSVLILKRPDTGNQYYVPSDFNK